MPNLIYIPSAASAIFDSAASFSNRAIDSFSSSIMRVRRSSDGAEADFTATEVTDGTLTTWTGANDGFVVDYDGQKNANTLSQITSTAQPQIVNSGTLNTDSNGNPVLDFDGTSDNLETTGSSILNIGSGVNPEYSIIGVFEFNVLSNTVICAFTNGGNTQDFHSLFLRSAGELRFFSRDTAGTIRVQQFFGTISTGTQYIVEIYLGSTLNCYINGTQVVTNASLTSTLASSPTIFTLMSNYNNTNNINGKVKELHLFDSDVSSNRTAYYNDINGYWS